MSAINKATTEKYGLSRLFLLTMLFSLFGWAFETFYIYFVHGHWSDRGFLSLPFCPIYGCSIVFTYLLLGTPDECKIKKTSNATFGEGLTQIFYFYVCFIIPTLMELLVGLIFDKTFQVRLWNYAYEKHHLNGYICLKNSIVWAVMLFLFMKYLFPPLKRWIGKLPKRFVNIAAWALLVSVVIDFILNLTIVLK